MKKDDSVCSCVLGDAMISSPGDHGARGGRGALSMLEYMRMLSTKGPTTRGSVVT